MKISSIKQQQKRNDRYSIYVDGKYSFSLGELELINSRLKVGQELTKEALDKLKDTAVLDKAYDRALHYVALRIRSEWEIHEYLKRKKYEIEQIEGILNRLSIAGFVNDEAFARTWTVNRHLLKPISKRRLVQELRQKHISSEIIDKILAEDESDERTVLRELVAKKRKLTKYQDELKLMQYLGRQGFSYDDIKSVLCEEEYEATS